MIRYDQRFECIENAKVHLDWLVESKRILNYELRPSYDEYGFEIYVKPYPALQKIEITEVGDKFRRYTLG